MCYITDDWVTTHGGVKMRIDESFLTVSRLGKPLEPPEEKKNDGDITGGFKNILDDLMEATKETSAASRAETAKLLTGTMEDFPEFMVTGEKSSITFELNLAVRNKVIDAYTEIMRTSV